jgi:hypothetical protein
MKFKFLISLLLLVLQSYSQKQQGTITLIDGTVLTGTVKVTDDAFKYRENENSEWRKFDHNSAVAATFINSSNVEEKFEFIYLEKKVSPLLLQVVVDGYLKLYFETTSYQGVGAQGIGPVVNNVTTYYIKRKTETTAQYFTVVGSIAKTAFKEVVKSYFTDCPQLQKKVADGVFKKKHVEEIVKFYNQNCAPK